ncbi:MAG TPA: hypothetical protein DCL44_06585 [Elusimicrobia bacterium]|nr:hypothetical protein [Elusimicrobiota bacterium]
MIKKTVSFVGFFLLFSMSVSAQVRVAAVSWEASSPQAKTWTPFMPITGLKLQTHKKMTDKLRAIFTVRNSSMSAVEGIVLRYSLRLRLIKAGDNLENGVWSVPFRVEELRLAKVGAGESRQVRATRFELNGQIKKLVGAGFWFDALKLEVMVDPRYGDGLSGIVQESVIAVTTVKN